MWTPITRRQHSREHLRYGSDLTDAEWAIIVPLLRRWRRLFGHGAGHARYHQCHPLYAALALPVGAWCRTAFLRARRFTAGSSRLRDEGEFETINHHLLIRDRERVGS